MFAKKGYAHAWDCGNCPQSGDPAAPRACPMWWEMTFENPKTDEVKVEKACGFILLPRLMIEVIKAANRPAASIDKTCNVIAEGLAHVARAAEQARAFPAFGVARQHPRALDHRHDPVDRAGGAPIGHAPLGDRDDDYPPSHLP